MLLPLSFLFFLQCSDAFLSSTSRRITSPFSSSSSQRYGVTEVLNFLDVVGTTITLEPLPFTPASHPMFKDMVTGMVLAFASDVLAQLTSTLNQTQSSPSQPSKQTPTTTTPPSSPYSPSTLKRVSSVVMFNNSHSNGNSVSLFSPAKISTLSSTSLSASSTHDLPPSPSLSLTSLLSSARRRIAAVQFDFLRTSRFALFGFFDGAVGHTWFHTLETFVPDYRLVDIITRILADALFYTPLWCLWFLTAMNFLEGRLNLTLSFSMGNPMDRLTAWTNDWLSLVKLSSSVYLPISVVLYSFVPVHRRVFASALGTMICTVILSIWNATRPK